jgi:hypothetical protein
VLYRLAADAVVVFHLLFIVFVVVGGFLAWRWRWLPWIHLPMAFWGMMIEFAGWICPLTPLENALRARAGQAGYEGGFIEHYVLPVIYPGNLTRTIQIGLGLLVLLVNVVAYVRYFRSRPAHRT